MLEIPENVVDWILVELRDKFDNSIIKYSRAAFLLNTGMIVDLDGNSLVKFELKEDLYFLTIKHRNHLSVMSKEPVNILFNN